MAETPLEDLPLATLRRMRAEAQRAAEEVSEAEHRMYMDGTGSPVDRAMAGADWRIAWLKVKELDEAIHLVTHHKGEMVQTKGDLL